MKYMTMIARSTPFSETRREGVDWRNHKAGVIEEHRKGEV